MIFNRVFLLLIPIFIISCKSEAEKISERNSIIDSTITAFQKNLLKTEIDSVFEKNHFNGSISVFQNGEKLYERKTVSKILRQNPKSTAIRFLRLVRCRSNLQRF